MNIFQGKCNALHEQMDQYAKADVAIAFSGGIDSSLLLKVATEHSKAYGTKVYAITADTELHPTGDVEIAQSVANEMGAIHQVLAVNELEEADIRYNPVDRCYRCKHYLFEQIIDLARKKGVCTVMDGTNFDDLLVYRPGLKALDELGIASPLKDCGFTKEEVRELAIQYDISVAKRPSAPCLATRFPYGDELSVERMERVDTGEHELKKLGLYNVRIRVHGDICRIEVDDKYITKLVEHRDDIVDCLKKIGYTYITLDLEGFRSGSMDIHVNHKKDNGKE